MSKPILIIDPGHGGKDGGGGTNKYFKEKDKVLEISKYQYSRFKELGVPVAMTRTTDEYLDSVPRTNRVKNSGAKYCISNHINAGGGQGAETIHSIKNNGKLAKTLAKGIEDAGQNVRRVFSRKGKSGDYYYMHRMTGNVETVIIEYGFADNKTDTERIIKNWKAYAEGVVKAFCEYIGHKYVAPGNKTTIIKTEVKGVTSDSKPTTTQKPEPKKQSSVVLGKGDKGTKVIQLQKDLVAVGESLPKFGADGHFGSETEAAVKSFQRKEGIAVDGLVGSVTRSKLDAALKSKPESKSVTSTITTLPTGILKRGSRGKKVEQLQTALNSLNFKCGKVDGIYGIKTKDAVIRFQKVYLPKEVDGIYGPNTKREMEKQLRKVK